MDQAPPPRDLSNRGDARAASIGRAIAPPAPASSSCAALALGGIAVARHRVRA